MSTKEVKVKKINYIKKEVKFLQDFVAVDESLCIFLNGEHYRILVATPQMTKELIIGHLFTESVIESTNDIESIAIDRGKADITLKNQPDIPLLQLKKIEFITTACGTGVNIDAEIKKIKKVSQKKKISTEKVMQSIQELNQRSKIYKQTGGTHSAILLKTDGEVIKFAEDVGRHNAIDKVIGYGLIHEIDFSECILFSSGRLSSDMVLKIVRAGITLVGSLSAPLHSGIRLAKASGITLIGFIRGRRLNVYTNEQAIMLN